MTRNSEWVCSGTSQKKEEVMTRTKEDKIIELGVVFQNGPFRESLIIILNVDYRLFYIATNQSPP